MSKCIVSWTDSGIRNSVEVEAESLYEAAVKGLKELRYHCYEPQGLHILEVEEFHVIKHTLTVKQVHAWLEKPGRIPKDISEKARLKELLGDHD